MFFETFENSYEYPLGVREGGGGGGVVRKMLISVKLLVKYVIIVYALSSVHEKFGV